MRVVVVVGDPGDRTAEAMGGSRACTSPTESDEVTVRDLFGTNFEQQSAGRLRTFDRHRHVAPGLQLAPDQEAQPAGHEQAQRFASRRFIRAARLALSRFNITVPFRKP